jgi:hypothetical protein
LCGRPEALPWRREAARLEQLPLPLLIALIVLAVVLGLYLGHRAGKAFPRAGGKDGGKSLGTRAREAAQSGVVKLWKWNRARKKAAKDKA